MTATESDYHEVSAFDDPALANSLAQKAMEPTTSAPELPETTGTLPCGWRTPTGLLATDFEIRELTGISEERLAKVAATKKGNYAQICRVLLEEGLVNIGGHKPDDFMMRSLLLGDRDYLLMKIRIATYGADYDAKIICPKCGESQDVVFELEEGYDMKYLPAKSTDATYSVNLRNGRTASVRLVTAEDQAVILADTTITGSERNTLLLSRCLLSINGNPLMDVNVARSLSAGDRKILMSFLEEHRFGPQLEEVMAVCSYCKEESEMSLSMAALFL